MIKLNKETTNHRMRELACANNQASAAQQRSSSDNIFTDVSTLEKLFIHEKSCKHSSPTSFYHFYGARLD